MRGLRHATLRGRPQAGPAAAGEDSRVDRRTLAYPERRGLAKERLSRHGGGGGSRITLCILARLVDLDRTLSGAIRCGRRGFVARRRRGWFWGVGHAVSPLMFGNVRSMSPNEAATPTGRSALGPRVGQPGLHSSCERALRQRAPATYPLSDETSLEPLRARLAPAATDQLRDRRSQVFRGDSQNRRPQVRRAARGQAINRVSARRHGHVGPHGSRRRHLAFRTRS